MMPMRAIALALAAALALPAAADTSRRKTSVDYSRFAPLSATVCPRAWQIVPGGRFIANQAGNDVLLTEAATGKEHGRLAGHIAGVHDAGFSADGRFMATAGNDAAVKIWDLTTLKEVRSIDAFGAYS